MCFDSPKCSSSQGSTQTPEVYSIFPDSLAEFLCNEIKRRGQRGGMDQLGERENSFMDPGAYVECMPSSPCKQQMLKT